MPDYIFSARTIDNNQFGDSPDEQLHYLIIPDGGSLDPQYETSQKEWLLGLIAPVDGLQTEDILIYVHGYNNTEIDVLDRHRDIKAGLGKQQYKGTIVSFDWPCGNSPLMYLPDRHKAKKTAMELVNGGIALLAAQQQNDCTINVHVLAHSTGAYVIREAFHDADDTNVSNDGTKVNAANWMVTQMVFISGDVSSDSMSADSAIRTLPANAWFTTVYIPAPPGVESLPSLCRDIYAGSVGCQGGAWGFG